MKSVLIKESRDGTAVFIDGMELSGATYIKIEKIGGEPMTIEIRGAFVNEVQAETE